MQIDLGERKIAPPDRFYVRHISSVKQDVALWADFYRGSLLLYYSLVFLHLLLTHFVLVIDFKELCFKFQLDFLYFF